MKGIKLWLFVLLGLLSVQLYTALYPASSANALSVYDDLLLTTNNLTTKSPDGTKMRTITNSYISVMQDKCPTAFVSYQGALNDVNGRWAVVQYTDWDGGNPQEAVEVAWSTNPSHQTLFLDYGFSQHIAVPAENRALIYVDDEDHFTCDVRGATGDQAIAYLQPSSPVFKLFISTYPVVYPLGYEGRQIRDTYTPVLNLSYSINFKINGSFKDFSAQYTNKSTNPVSNLPDPAQIRWMLVDKSKIDIEADTVGSRYSPLCDVYLEINQPFTSQECGHDIINGLDMSKDYMITAQGILSGDQEQGYLIEYLFVSFDIDFNNPQYGLDTGNCSLSEGATDSFNGKACAGDSRYQDCTELYGDITKLGEIIGCYFNNIQVWFQDILMFLFVPSPRYLLETYTDMDEFMHQKLGLLLYPFDWIFLLFNSFLNAANSCAGPNLSAIPNVSAGGTFFGSPVNLNVCSAEQNFPQIYNVAVFFIRVVSVLGMVLACYRKLLLTLNDHQDRGKELYG